jgi:hypothetical protein
MREAERTIWLPNQLVNRYLSGIVLWQRGLPGGAAIKMLSHCFYSICLGNEMVLKLALFNANLRRGRGRAFRGGA